MIHRGQTHAIILEPGSRADQRLIRIDASTIDILMSRLDARWGGGSRVAETILDVTGKLKTPCRGDPSVRHGGSQGSIEHEDRPQSELNIEKTTAVVLSKSCRGCQCH